ncbi:hypothetical protein L083_1297 [Actinoplanes sp. N902-109]|nr:hypothetical protein L083_1297 [Actinoplanes sp. N902-109]
MCAPAHWQAASYVITFFLCLMPGTPARCLSKPWLLPSRWPASCAISAWMPTAARMPTSADASQN